MLCYFFQTLSWKFWSSVESLSARLWKLLSTCPYEHFFLIQSFLEKLLFYFSFWDREWFFLGFRRKFFDEVVKIAFFVPIKTLQVFFSKKYYSFWSVLYIERFFWTLCWNFSDEVVKIASYPFIGSSWWEKHFDEKTLMFFNQFETFSEKF